MAPPLRGDGPGYNLGQGDRLPDRARLDDSSGNTTAVRVFTIPVDQIGQLVCRQAIDQIGRRLTGNGIHAHVQRAILLKREASLRLLKL